MNASLSSLHIHRKVLFQLAAVSLLLPLCVIVAQPFLNTLDWGQVALALQNIAPFQWCTAILATAASFVALGRYDVIIHRVLNTKVSAQAAQASGAAAVALSQTLGFGLVVGTLARWRGLPSLNIVTTGAVTTLVSLSFLAAWLAVFAIAGLLSPYSLPLPSYVYHASLFSALCLTLYTALKRYLTIGGFRARLPSLRAVFALMFYTALDTFFAALAFWLLFPSGFEMGLLFFFPIYLTCLGIALISNSPGGLGPFEVTLLWALPQVDLNALLASLIAFRLIYFALPACIAMIYLIRPLPDKTTGMQSRIYSQGLHPETASGLQTGTPLHLQSGKIVGALARTTQTTTLLFDPATDFESCCEALRAKAKANATGMLFYKCHSRFAAILRKNGYAVARIAQDGVIDLAQFSLQEPSRRTLRRKLRAVQKAGLSIKALPLNEQTYRDTYQIDAAWNQTNGTALGVSMGRYQPEYLASQAVFGAFYNDKLVAFISCHKTPECWTLDLMRGQTGLVNGTMHALVLKALEAARDAGCDSFSLASTAYEDWPMLNWIKRLNLRQRTSTQGLAQFKRSFAPKWQPLYAAAPSKAGLYLALWDVWQEVHDPPPLKTRH